MYASSPGSRSSPTPTICATRPFVSPDWLSDPAPLLACVQGQLAAWHALDTCESVSLRMPDTAGERGTACNASIASI